MSIVWFLLFNCTTISGEMAEAMGDKGGGGLEASNLVMHLEKSYKTEQKCLKDAARGAKNVLPAGKACYFVCVKGFSGKGQK